MSISQPYITPRIIASFCCHGIIKGYFNIMCIIYAKLLFYVDILCCISRTFPSCFPESLILQTGAFGEPAGKPHNALCLYQHISVVHVCVRNFYSKVIWIETQLTKVC